MHLMCNFRLHLLFLVCQIATALYRTQWPVYCKQLPHTIVTTQAKEVYYTFFGFTFRCSHMCLLSLSVSLWTGAQLSSQQGPPPLPPAPPPHHKHHPSITSLSRGSLANQRSPSPPPSAGLVAELQSAAECVQLQDSWVLGSNVALESRWVTHNAPEDL